MAAVPSGSTGARWGRARWLAIGLIATAWGGAAASPIDELLGRPIVAVRLESAGEEVREPALLELVEAKPGTVLTVAAVRESVLHLFSLGRFRDVRVEATAAGDGVVLRFLLIPARTITAMTFRGRLGLSEGDLRRAVTERFGPIPQAARLDEAVRALQAYYRQRGYHRARVAARLVEDQADRATLVFDVEAGPRARLAAARLEGSTPWAQETLLARLGLKPGQPLDEATLERRLDDVVADLRRRGYYEARAARRVFVSDDGERAEVTVAVEVGPHVTVRFEGDTIPPDERDRLVPIAREGSIDEDLLEDSSRRIVEYLRAQGYWRAEASHARRVDNGEVQIVFTVRRGRLYRVAAVEVHGVTALAREQIDSLLRSRPGRPFVEGEFDADVAALVERYRRLGYADARVESAVEEASGAQGAGLVVLRLLVHEGVRTFVEAVQFEGARAFTADALRRVIKTDVGAPLYRPQLAADRDALLLHYLNDGYVRATVAVDVAFGPDRSRARITFRIQEGPQVRVDHILIVGNVRTSAAVIRRELTLQPGSPLGLDDLLESQRRVSALGLFRRVRLSELDHGIEQRRDLLVAVEEAPATALGYGGGLEVGQRLRQAAATGGARERLEAAPRGFIEWSRRNLGGKNRSVDLFARVSLRPRDRPDEPARDGEGFGFSEYRVLATYREPRPWGWAAEWVVTGFLEQAVRSSFNLNRQGVAAELRRRLAARASLSARYSYQRNRLFDERLTAEDRPLVDRLFPQVKLSTFSASAARDTRDDPLDPVRGSLVEADGDLAGRSFGSEVGFARMSLQGFLYRPLPAVSRVVFAAGARMGLAAPFPRAVPSREAPGEVTIVREIPASVRFFAGGDTTVRGFALDRLGDEGTIDKSGFPKGGNALVVFNAELRLPTWRGLGLVTFLDAGNVFARVADVDLGRLRAGAGIGLRYRSPIGPLRVDVGFKLGELRVLGGVRERRRAVHISIGQAF
jgi:outer membrane protein insertion porin family